MRNNVRLLDVLDRAETGPVMDEKEFDLKMVAGKVPRLQREFNIHWDRVTLVNTDNELADRAFEAGLKMAADVGLYCTDTGRRIVFTREELLRYARHAPIEVPIGEHLDRHIVRKRVPEDKHPPTIIGGPLGQTLPEDLFVPIMHSHALEPIVDTVINGTLETCYGRDPRTHSPWEVMVAWRELELCKLAVSMAGRPGIAIGCVENAPSEIGEISASSYSGFSQYDWHQVAVVSELKTNYALLSKIAHLVRTQCVIHGFYNAIYGGLPGGAEGAAISTVAGMLLIQAAYMATSHAMCPTHPFNLNDTGPETLWAMSLATQALAGHTNLMIDVLTSPVGGPGTKTLLYECAAVAAMGTCSGAARLMGVRATCGKYRGHSSGLESRFNGEVGHAIAGMSREQVNEIVKRTVPKYINDLPQEPKGKVFPEVYDMRTMRPNSEWQGLYEEVKEEMVALGIPLV
ncbi:MAG: monomethylamine:corrinoid methyltransferase [Chloroflexi bacterium]|nr:monomethylamine:corrinoid methyltransferase [Chloroflexota bacterium]MCL5076134.1 monomethylamine:corrinoid methyltransferase [Chloroflexota bacterium]